MVCVSDGADIAFTIRVYINTARFRHDWFLLSLFSWGLATCGWHRLSQRLSLSAGFIGGLKRVQRGGGGLSRSLVCNGLSSHRLFWTSIAATAGFNGKVGRELKCRGMMRFLYMVFVLFWFSNYTLCVWRSLPAGWLGAKGYKRIAQ
jgi:hypothetical protein